MAILQTVFNPNDLNLRLAVDSVIKNRRTYKVLGSLDQVADIPDDFKEKVEESVRMAGWAPFHYPSHESHRQQDMNSIVPWRFYVLDQATCLKLAHYLLDKSIANLTKDASVIRMLAATGALALVTWLPEPESKLVNNKLQHKNEEHLAAAAAAVQNLLLAGEAREIQTYWSSGGALKSRECFELCRIPTSEKLLAAVFMFPKQIDDSSEVHAGHLAQKRGERNTWRKWLSIND